MQRVGVHCRGAGRLRGLASQLLDLRAQRFDNGVIGLRLVEFGGDEIEQQAPVSGFGFDNGYRTRRLSEHPRRARDAEKQCNQAGEVPVHGGAESRGVQYGFGVFNTGKAL